MILAYTPTGYMEGSVMTDPQLRQHRATGTIAQVTASPAEKSSVKLEIAGMSCASCAMRIEEKLNRLGGVNATVNFATETATVTVPSGYDPQSLVEEVERAGYAAVLPQQRRRSPPRPATPSCHRCASD